MKIRLLNDAGYRGMEDVVFPVEVDAEIRNGKAFIPSRELYRVGATCGFDIMPEYCFPPTVWGYAE